MLPYCIRLLYDALPAPTNPASYPLSRPGWQSRSPTANVLSGVSPACHIPQPAPNRKPRLAFMQQELTFPIFLGFPTPPNAKTPLSISTAPVPGVAAHLLSGVSPSGTILRSFPGQKPRLAPVKPCGCGAGGWPAQRNPSRRTRLGLRINQGA